ncbi:3-oxoacyl-[acyl-carrier-protein] synthase II [Micromonospora sp. Llam0]|uniref:beta-ketoacyl-[acyl-carrier-protein] synthase family protein n=1 Tax=Micromonospora sp. Llam0 TaxID=2485143 RepID=UPI000F465AA3|nr:beta-ketoacyl-[acyl-carrier-protein] synthase family protein [Micromonospora sp. Llam0]ROO51999.1 3-oxoacyl-[acyl-carrier-protein] synthase II [Micromonospora sp. Llam0]
MSRRVVITGIGLLTGLGEGAAANWDALLAGRSAIARLTGYDPSPLHSQLGAELAGFDPLRFASRKALRMLNRGDQLGLAGATLAVADAGLDTGTELGHRTGLFLGGGKEISRLDDLIANLSAIRAEGGTADLLKLGRTASSVLPPLFFVEGLQPAAVFHVSEKFGIRGPNCFFAGTADSGARAIGRAMRAIRRGEADRAIAGGYDDASGWWSMSKMDGLGVLCTDNDAGSAAFRPFDSQRSGSVLGEGAAILVLEERNTALARGVPCYAELIGFGEGNDCRPAPSPDPQGRGVAAAMRRALDDSRLEPGALSYVAAHGSATWAGDISEARAIRHILGPAQVPVSTVKPQTGHLVGGAGALNVAVAALALRHGAAPATLNLDDPDPGCDLDHIRREPMSARLHHALALARGFEGQATALALTTAH